LGLICKTIIADPGLLTRRFSHFSHRLDVGYWPKTLTGDVFSHVSDQVTNGHVADSSD
jgi:hypothetical protein